MKSFYRSDASAGAVAAEVLETAPIISRARVAVYDSMGAAPRVCEIDPCPVDEYIEGLSSLVYDLAKQQGGTVPYTVIREVTENFIHANFAEPVVSILDQGRTLRFADQGPGISDKNRAVLPGFTTASGAMKEYIRGVGSGLPIVSDYLSYSGGSLAIEDNLGSGAVITLRATGAGQHAQPAPLGRYVSPRTISTVAAPATPDVLPLEDVGPVGPVSLTTRQTQVLALVMELGSAGPSAVSKELGVGISTAYRDLASLEDLGLIEADGGKRRLTDEGAMFLSRIAAR